MNGIDSKTVNTKINNNWLYFSAIILLLAGALSVVYYQTVSSMVSIWLSSETFTHGFLILPISLWLIYEKRNGLRGLGLDPKKSILLLILPIGLVWLLSHLVDVQVVQQYAFVAIAVIFIWSVLGNKTAFYLMFPLGFLFFLVPAGLGLEPSMMEFTADFTVAMLKLTGIPVYRDGNFFSIPTGNWSVVEACSGVRYLIASVTLGFLFAYLTYHKWWKRVIFILFSILVPIIANGLRAYMIVMIGHLSGMKLAVGVDHLIYGWLFFGVVVTIMFVIGSFWRDPVVEDPQPSDDVLLSEKRTVPFKSIALTLVLGLIAVSVWPAMAYIVDQENTRSSDVYSIRLPVSQQGWRRIEAPSWDWKPGVVNPNTEIMEFYQKNGDTVAVYLGYFATQRKGAELISYSNRLIDNDDSLWRSHKSAPLNIDLNDTKVRVIQSKLTSNNKMLATWHWYGINGYYTSNDYLGKLLEAASQLLQSKQGGFYIILATPIDYDPKESTPVLQSFVNEMFSAIVSSMESVTESNKQ